MMLKMARFRSMPSDVREAVSDLIEQTRRQRGSLTILEAIETMRRSFPDLVCSDRDLIDAIVSEAVATSLALEFDVPGTNSSGWLDRWDNEGGAIKKKPTESELREARRRVDNDTDGTRRRAEEVKSRNQMF